jgi:hypothetical protein
MKNLGRTVIFIFNNKILKKSFSLFYLYLVFGAFKFGIDAHKGGKEYNIAY